MQIQGVAHNYITVTTDHIYTIYLDYMQTSYIAHTLEYDQISDILRYSLITSQVYLRYNTYFDNTTNRS